MMKKNNLLSAIYYIMIFVLMIVTICIIIQMITFKNDYDCSNVEKQSSYYTEHNCERFEK